MSHTFKLRNGRLLISTEAPGGIYNASQLKKIASLCDGDSVMVKATEDQRLALIVDPEKANMVASELRSMGLGIRHYQDGLHQPVSCIGEMCEFHEQDALGSALDVSNAIEGIKLDNPLKIGINGCARCCVPCHTLDISVVGDSHGYRISLGGKNSQLPEIAGFLAEGVPPTEIPRLTTSIIEIYKANAQEGETLQELIDRQGPSQFIKALAPWSQDAASTGDPFASEYETVTPPPPPTVQNDIEITPESIHDGDPEPQSPSLVEANDTNIIVSNEAVSPHDIDARTPTPLSSAAASNESLGTTNMEMEMEMEMEMDMDMDMTDDSSSATTVEHDMMDHSETSTTTHLETEQLSIDEDLHNVPSVAHEIELHETDKIHDESEHIVYPAPAIPFASAIESAEGRVTTVTKENDHFNADIEPQQPQTIATASDIKLSDPSIDEEIAEAKIIADIDARAEDVENDSLEFDRVQTSGFVDGAKLSLKNIPQPNTQPDTNSPVANNLPTVSDLDTHDSNYRIPHIKVVSTKKSRSLASFEIDDAGNPVISWSNGMILALTKDAIDEGTLRFCGHEIRITKQLNGINVDVDGIKMFLPVAA